jgi:hypothetical protein
MQRCPWWWIGGWSLVAAALATAGVLEAGWMARPAPHPLLPLVVADQVRGGLGTAEPLSSRPDRAKHTSVLGRVGREAESALKRVENLWAQSGSARDAQHGHTPGGSRRRGLPCGKRAAVASTLRHGPRHVPVVQQYLR